MAGDLIAVRLPPGPGFVSVLDRVWGEGDALLPLPWRAPDRVIQEIVRTLAPTALVQPEGDGSLHTRRLPHRKAVPAGTALVLVTSGSTGAPKGVELSHAALSASVRTGVRRLGCQRGEAWLGCLPVSHVAGIQTILRSRAVGAEPVLHERFDVTAVARTSRVAWVSLVPTQLARLLDAGADVGRFRGILLGGGHPPPGLLQRAADAGARVTVSYGMTETSGGCVYDGIPLDGVQVAAVDGRLRVRGPVLMRGYRGEPAATRAAFHDGWFVTGDLGRVDEDGHVTVLGRADDVIVTGGENVAAGRVAAVLAEHPSVQQVAVVGRADAEWGEVVVAVVVPTDGDAPPTLGDLREFAGERLPPAALPREVWTLPSLPRDEMGKLSRSALKTLVERRSPTA